MKNFIKIILGDVIMGRFIDLTGQIFNRLTVLYKTNNKLYNLPNI